LDGLIDYVVSVAVYLGLGIGLASASGHPLTWWLILAATGASHIFHSLSVDFYRTRFLDHVEGPSISAEEDYSLKFQIVLDGLKAQKGQILRKAAIRVYLRYLNVQTRMTARAAAAGRGKRSGGDDYYAKNKAAMRGWTFLGSSTGGTLLIVSALLGRFDFYFWGRIVVMNLWAAIMIVIQRRIDHSLPDETAP
jgi:hypothetical protein